jgi:hypothetical protein
MAIIYSYPTATPNMNTLLLGTAVDAETGLNVTKQFSVSAIGSLIAQTYDLTPAYRTYYAYLTQTGSTWSDAPTVLANNLNGTLAFTRVTTGTYQCTISGVDTFDKTWYALTDNRFSLLSTEETYMVINKTSANVLTIYTYKSGVLSDGVLLVTPLEIKIFD